MFNESLAHKKNRPELSGQEKIKGAAGFLTHSNVACNCQNENPLFCECERKPDFVIKFFHHPVRKPELSNRYSVYANIIPQSSAKSQEKSS
jgi:hypothetical protein